MLGLSPPPPPPFLFSLHFLSFVHLGLGKATHSIDAVSLGVGWGSLFTRFTVPSGGTSTEVRPHAPRWQGKPVGRETQGEAVDL